jgi:hypothetical protein
MPPLPKAKPASKKPPSRARKPTTKAKAANELDASEEDLPAAITSTKKKMLTKSKATHKKKAVLEISDSEGQARGDDDAGDDDKVEWVIFHDYLGYKFETSTRSWKDIDLNWSLIMILEEDQVIRQGLFPVPGANISLSQGGKPKTDYQWMLAQKLFEDHEKYKDVFSSVQTLADKATWQRKIKNRLKR